MGQTRRAWVAMAALSVLTLIAGPATADPTQDELDRIQEQQATSGGTFGTFEVRFAAAQTRAEAAEAAIGAAAENYDAAVIELADSRRAASAAQASAAAAGLQAATAQRELGRIAAQAYREGGGLTTLATFLADRRPEEVLDRAVTLASVGERRQRTVQRLDAVRAGAASLQQEAEAAVASNRAAESRLAAARATAEASAVAARKVAAEAAVEQEELLVELAAARRTSAELERSRLLGLSEQRARAAAAAAEAGLADPATLGGTSSGSAAGGVAAVAWARLRVGLPYLWGGDGPDSYDCSGLTMRAWEASGVPLPHSSRAQYAGMRKVRNAELRPGDLLFFATDTSNPGTIHHVTLYAGGGLMVEAPATGLTVRVVPERWRGRMPFAGRP